MHEYSLCQQLFKLVSEQMQQSAIKKLYRVEVQMGSLLAVDIQAFQFAFNTLKRRDYPETELVLIHHEAIGQCPMCTTQQALSQRFDVCQNCNYYPLDILQGNEFTLTALEGE